MSNKGWGSVMMVRNNEQHRVIRLGTLKAFQEETGITRDYICETRNEIELAAAHRAPGVLLIEIERLSEKYVPYDPAVH